MLIGLSESSASGESPAYTEQVVGGTSEAAPLIAGIQADAQQALGRPIGFANPAIYLRYCTRTYHDVLACCPDGGTLRRCVPAPAPAPWRLVWMLRIIVCL